VLVGVRVHCERFFHGVAGRHEDDCGDFESRRYQLDGIRWLDLSWTLGIGARIGSADKGGWVSSREYSGASSTSNPRSLQIRWSTGSFPSRSSSSDRDAHCLLPSLDREGRGDETRDHRPPQADSAAQKSGRGHHRRGRE
jgi:hypothetical protein